MEATSWFEEDLEPYQEPNGDATKSQVPETPEDYFDSAYKHGLARVVVDAPRFMELDGATTQLRSHTQSGFVLVRLGFQLHPPGHDTKIAFNFARCSARLEATASDTPQPRIHDLYPTELFSEPAGKVRLSISPQLKIGPVELSGLSASSEITIGNVKPAVVGWAGEEERFPFWNIHPNGPGSIGQRHFWMIVELPFPSRGLMVSVLAEAEIAGRFGPLRLGPKQRLWDQRPQYKIALD